jgi:myo-inositol 2-dehydrogenase/D-chiro-inositol 1-dehydrogenase
MTDHAYFFLERFDQAFVDEIRAFVDAVAAGKPVRVTGEDGRAALALAYAAEASVREKCPVQVARFAKGAAI